MAFENWKPSTFTLDDYVLRWPSGKRRQQRQLTQAPDGIVGSIEPLNDGIRGSWRQLGLDEQIAEILENEQGWVAKLVSGAGHAAHPPGETSRCKTPFEIQRRIITAMLDCHHLDISSPAGTGVSTAVLASSLHRARDDPDVNSGPGTPSLLFLTSSTARASNLAARIAKLAAPFDFCIQCFRDDVPLSQDLDTCRSTTSLPDIVVSTLARCVVLLQQDALSLSSLSLLCLDFSSSAPRCRRAIRSHHTVSDVRSVLCSVGRECQVVVLCREGYEGTQLGKLVGRHQETSLKRNLKVMGHGENERPAEDGDATVGGPVKCGPVTVSDEWGKVVTEFELNGLTPDDFLAVKRRVARVL